VDIFDRLAAAGLTEVLSELATAQYNLAVLVAALSGRDG
jgi:hypothetical protein